MIKLGAVKNDLPKTAQLQSECLAALHEHEQMRKLAQSSKGDPRWATYAGD